MADREDDDEEEEEEEEDLEQGEKKDDDSGSASISISIEVSLTPEQIEAERLRLEQEEIERLRAEQEAERKRLIYNNEDLERLNVIISDLSRRLKNAEHTITAQRQASSTNARLEETYRSRIGEISSMLRLETSKNAVQQRKAMQSQEAKRYENEKRRATKMHEDLRMAKLDHDMTSLTTEPARLKKMKAQLETLEQQQDSQKLLLKQLAEFDKMVEALCAAAQQGSLEETRSLLKRGAGVNEPDSAGYLPLYYACASGHADVARLLLEFGGDASSYVSGHSSMEIAGRHGHTECIKTLLKFGANVEDKGLSGSTALLSAVAGGHLETVHELLQRKASVTAFNFNEDTVLHCAAQIENPVYMIRLLLKYGADKKVTNRQGYTPVRVALAKANSLAIEALGGRGAMIDLDGDALGGLGASKTRREHDDNLSAAQSYDSDSLKGRNTDRSAASSVTFNP